MVEIDRLLHGADHVRKIIFNRIQIRLRYRDRSAEAEDQAENVPKDLRHLNGIFLLNVLRVKIAVSIPVPCRAPLSVRVVDSRGMSLKPILGSRNALHCPCIRRPPRLETALYLLLSLSCTIWP